LISPIDSGDLQQLTQLVKLTVRESVVADEAQAAFLIDDVIKSLITWLQDGVVGYSAKVVVDDAVLGFVVVKDFWNLSHLFVVPEHQRQGVGQTLLNAAIDACRELSPRNSLRLNSSTTAAPFYAAQGFHQTGPAHDRPGGCVPFEFEY